MMATSPDGMDWDLVGVGTNAIFTAGAAGNGRLVAASSRGVFLSTDGHNWAKAVTVINGFNDMDFGNGLFVGVTSGNTVSRSADGSTWTTTTIAAVSTALTRVSFARDRFFALAASTPPQLSQYYWSTDATNWTGPVSLNTNGIQKVVWGNGTFVGLNMQLSGTIYWSEFRTSTDGMTWSAPMILPNHLISDIAFCGGQFVAVDQLEQVWLSPNGTTWTNLAAPELFAASKVATDGNRLIASGLGGRIVGSTDATNWTSRTTGPQNSLVGVTRFGGLFVAVGGNQVPGGGDPYSVPTAVTSTNGRDWAEQIPGTTNALVAVTAGNGRLVAVGNNGVIVTSTDATNWSTVVSPTTIPLWSVAYGAGQFVAVGGTNHATIINSPDGVNWTAQSGVASYDPLYAVTYGQNQFVVVGQTNVSKLATTLTSADGLNWTPRTSTAANNLRSITSGNGLYVAVGDRATLVVSSDAVTWTNLTPATVINWRGVAYGNGWFVAVGSPPVLYVSTNGVNWTLRTALNSVTLQPLCNIVAGDNSFFLLGYGAEVIESGLFNPPAPQINLGLRQTDRTFLSFTAAEGHTYEIQSADSFPPTWQSLMTVTNASATTTLPISAATNNNARFYRVKLVN
ncbi:MAG: cell wall/surface repeat protein, partial [Pedosphaera sp.]|nr:cell wall/surface repeat protein [Pedosphaera sp.]